MRAQQAFCAVASILALAASARAEPRWVLRMATIAPDGTAWAHEIKALSNEVEAATRGEVHLKWYYGGIAGTDVQVGDRIARGQLDGAASGGMLCSQLAPAMRVMRVRGAFRSREEAAHVLNRIRPTIDDQFHKSGFVHLASTGLGADIAFSRTPIRSFDDLRRLKGWRWDVDDVARLFDQELGFAAVPMPLEDAASAFDDGKLDGFYAVPTAALAFQWYTRVHYLLDLPLGYVWGCLLVTERAFDRLPPDHRAVLRSAAAKLGARLEALGREQDEALLHGLFQRQGVTPTQASSQLRNELYTSALMARERLGEKLVPKGLLQEVWTILADYRAEHVGGPSR
jgi:TRAP-type C4-dicarboxylate transport system substrate-binding protein